MVGQRSSAADHHRFARDTGTDRGSDEAPSVLGDGMRKGVCVLPRHGIAHLQRRTARGERHSTADAIDRDQDARRRRWRRCGRRAWRRLGCWFGCGGWAWRGFRGGLGRRSRHRGWRRSRRRLWSRRRGRCDGVRRSLGRRTAARSEGQEQRYARPQPPGFPTNRAAGHTAPHRHPFGRPTTPPFYKSKPRASGATQVAIESGLARCPAGPMMLFYQMSI